MDISKILQERHDRATELLNSLLRHVATLSVAGIGFLLSVQGAGLIKNEPLWLYRLALSSFLISVTMCLYGQIAIVSATLHEPSKIPKFLQSSQFWFICAWSAFALGVLALFVLAL